MNYELAKKLKDAGFPQYEPNGFPGIMNPDGDKAVYYPTLSKLIESCGDDFKEMYRADKSGKSIWVAKCCDNSSHVGEGSTPEEAVANLWLALNNAPKPSLNS
jgi:hypothetical protein